MEIQLRELSTKEEMLAHIDMMRHLYPTFTIEKYDTYRRIQDLNATVGLFWL